MKRLNSMKKTLKPTLLASAIALALAAGPVSAEVYDLCAEVTTKTMPDGVTQVPMWGYALDTDPATAGCQGAIEIPGPVLQVTDGTLTINLLNNLPVETSIVIPGQALPTSSASGPTWSDNTTGARAGDLTKRVRSFGVEAAANGGTESYSWTVERSGSFMYHSGTYPQLQVYMGLYGAVTKDAAVGAVYPGVTYDNEVTLFYSDIDPVHNAAVASGAAYTPIDYNASWFLVNGEPYVAGTTLPIPAGAAGESTLVRFLSAASENHVPVFQGLHGMIHGEDGIQYTWQNGSVVGGTAPREQYSVDLPPLQTKDVIITPNADGLYAVYDGNGYMTNPSNPDDPSDGGDTVGGMLRFLEVGPAAVTSLIANPDAYTATEDTLLSVPAAGVLTNDTDADGVSPLPVTAVAQLVLPPASGNVILNPDGSFDYTPNLNVDTADSFTYEVFDTATSLTSNVATVSIGITPVNDAPSIVSTPLLTATEGLLYNYDVEATDPDTGDVLTFSLGTSPAGMTIDSATGLISWTPTATDVGVNPVTVLATDTSGLFATQTYSLTVDPVAAKTPPVAVADFYDVNEDAILDVAAPGVLGNDTATDGDPMTAALVSGPNCAWTDGPSGVNAFVLNADGSFHYEPIPDWNSNLDNPFCNGFTGADSFSYTANDVDGASNTVTVEITVNPVNDAPVAVADIMTMTAMSSITFPAPGVLVNDTDVDSALLSAVRDTNPGRGNISDWPIGTASDGGFTYNFPNIRVGVITSFDYHATDTLADSNLATVTIRRELSVSKVECELDVEPNPDICKWVVEGRISNEVPNGSTIEVRLGTGELIATVVETGGTPWSIQIDSTIIPSAGDVVDVRVIDNLTDPEAANAFILGFPVIIK